MKRIADRLIERELAEADKPVSEQLKSALKKVRAGGVKINRIYIKEVSPARDMVQKIVESLGRDAESDFEDHMRNVMDESDDWAYWATEVWNWFKEWQKD